VLEKTLSEHSAAVESLRAQWELLKSMAHFLASCINRGGTIYLCGNGGSAADCQHLAAELVGRFQRERLGFRAVALTTDTSILTAVGNDYGFEHVFSRQVRALARPGDVLVCISTSGNSANVLEAARAATDLGIPTLAMTGKPKSMLSRVAAATLHIDSEVTARVQEAHIVAGHIICELIDGGLDEANLD